MFSCKDFTVHCQWEYLMQRLPPGRRAEVESHLHECPDCRLSFSLNRPGFLVDCREVITDFLGQYVDGTLPPDERTAFLSHLRLCEECRDYLDSYQRTIRLAAATAAASVVVEAPPKLIAAIMALRQACPS